MGSNQLYLLHEEFAKPQDKTRVERMSRHLYDVHKMLNMSISQEALLDNELYDAVIEHRRTFIGMRGFDYSSLSKKTLNIIPPEGVYAAWKNDYESMQENMFYGASVPFDITIDDLRVFNQKIKQL